MRHRVAYLYVSYKDNRVILASKIAGIIEIYRSESLSKVLQAMESQRQVRKRRGYGKIETKEAYSSFLKVSRAVGILPQGYKLR